MDLEYGWGKIDVKIFLKFLKKFLSIFRKTNPTRDKEVVSLNGNDTLHLL
jgi:hypothetical protein